MKANRPEDPAVTAAGTPAGKLLIKNIAGVERALERAIGVEVSRLTPLHDLPRHDRLGVPVHRPLRDGLGHHAVVPGDRADRARPRSPPSLPGISEALVNTAAGLAAAIPALIFYNYFMGKVREQRAGMEDFALEFINLAERNFT